MQKTYQSEDSRKDKLWAGWNNHLGDVRSDFADQKFDEIYEGLTVVKSVIDNRIIVELEDGRIIKSLSVPPSVSEHSSGQDGIFAVLGRKGGRWYPLDIVTIFSLVNEKKGQAHLSVNPLHMDGGHALPNSDL